MKKDKTDRNKEFYKEVDLLRTKSSCAPWMIFVLLVVIFLLLLIPLAVVNYNSSLSLGVDTSFLSMFKKTKTVPKTESLGNNQVAVKVTEKELSDSLKISDQSFPLKNASLAITSSNIEIKGKTGQSILSLRVSVKLKPVVENNKAHLEISEITAAGLPAPKAVVDRISAPLGQQAATLSLVGDSYKAEEVYLYSGYVQIVASLVK